MFFEITAESAGPLDGVRLYVERLVAGSDSTGMSLSNLAATGVMIGARPDSRFGAALGGPDANEVVLSADRIHVFETVPAIAESTSQTLADLSIAIDNLNLESEFADEQCNGTFNLPVSAFSADITARVQFRRTGLHIVSDLMLRREGKTDIALNAQLNIRAADSESNSTDAAYIGKNASIEKFRSHSPEFLKQDNFKLKDRVDTISTPADAYCPRDLINSALAAADEILLAGTQISFSFKAKRSPKQQVELLTLPARKAPGYRKPS